MDHEHDMPLHDGPARVEQTGNAVCYHQSCPVCGRNLRIRVTLLGQRVYCQHCGGGFIASDSCSDTMPCQMDDKRRAAIVDELIERAAVMLGQDIPG